MVILTGFINGKGCLSNTKNLKEQKNMGLQQIHAKKEKNSTRFFCFFLVFL